MIAYFAPPVFSQEELDLKYRFAVGTHDNLVTEGIIWLYHYSWYGLEQFRLAEIKQGEARIFLNQSRLQTEIQPHPNTDAYIIVLEIPGTSKYRSVDIKPELLFNNLSQALNMIGEADKDSSGVTTLTLSKPFPHELKFESENDEVYDSEEVSVSIYIWNHNHCGHHIGFPIGTFRTDAFGKIKFLAPMVPLYLDVLYYKPDGQGPAGQMYAYEQGIEIGTEANQIINKVWRLPSRKIEFEVIRSDGSPISGATLLHCNRSYECGVHCGAIYGTTDFSGKLQATIIPQSVKSLAFAIDNKKRELIEDELSNLFSTGHITLIW